MKILSLITPAYLIFSLLQLRTCYPTFEEYYIKYGKNYTEQEKQVRKNEYERKLEHFKTIKVYEPGVNNMTDWFESEFKMLFNTQRSIRSEDHKLSQYSQDQEDRKKLQQYPEQLNWVELGRVTSVKNSQIPGASSIYAAIALLESHLIGEGLFDNTVDLSEQHLIDCMNIPLSIIVPITMYFNSINRGVVFEEQYPINSIECLPEEKRYMVGKEIEVLSAYGDGQLVQILQSGPVVVSVVGVEWDSYGRATFVCQMDSPLYQNVLLVGYTKDYWLIKNHWGTDWGEDGFMKLKKGGTKQQACGIHQTIFRLKFSCYEGCQKCITRSECFSCGSNCGCPQNKQFSESEGKCVPTCYKGCYNGVDCTCPQQFPVSNTSHCITCSESDQNTPLWTENICTSCPVNIPYFDGQMCTQCKFNPQFPIWSPQGCIKCPDTTPIFNGVQCIKCSDHNSSTPHWNGQFCLGCPVVYPFFDGKKCVTCSIDQEWDETIRRCTCPKNQFFKNDKCNSCAQDQVWDGVGCQDYRKNVQFEIVFSHTNTSLEQYQTIQAIAQQLGEPYSSYPRLIQTIQFSQIQNQTNISAKMREGNAQKVDQIKQIIDNLQNIQGNEILSVECKISQAPSYTQKVTLEQEKRQISLRTLIIVIIAAVVGLIIIIILMKVIYMKKTEKGKIKTKTKLSKKQEKSKRQLMEGQTKMAQNIGQTDVKMIVPPNM